MCSTPIPGPTGKNRVDDASLGIKQRERKQLSDFWQLLFCRLFNESAYRHLDLQFYNLFACRNPTSPNEQNSHPSGCTCIIPHHLTNNKCPYTLESTTKLSGMRSRV